MKKASALFLLFFVMVLLNNAYATDRATLKIVFDLQ